MAYYPSLDDIDKSNLKSDSSESLSDNSSYYPSMEDINPESIKKNVSQSPNYDEMNYITGDKRTPIDTLRDISYGLISGPAKGLAGLTQISENTTFGLPTKNIPPSLAKIAGIKSISPEEVENKLLFLSSPNKSIGGEVTKGISQYVPYAAAGGGSLLGQILAGGTYGGLTSNSNQNNLLSNVFPGFPSGKKGAAMEGALLNALGMGFLKGAPKAVNAFSPGKTAEDIKSSLSNLPSSKSVVTDTDKGITLEKPKTLNLRENSESLSKDIKDSYDYHTSIVGQKMNPVLSKYGQSLDIYPLENPSGIHAYREIPNFKLKGTESNDLYKIFKNDPNLNNANELQKKVGEEIGKIKSMKIELQPKNQLKNLNYAYKELNSKIESRLGQADPQALSEWKSGRDYHRDNVIPYRSNKKIRDVVEGKTTSPENIHQPFKYPGDKFDKKSKQYMTGNINKIISDLPEDSKNKILLSKIGGVSSNQSPIQLLNNLEKAKDKGYDTYFNEDLKDNINVLKKQIRNNNLINPMSLISRIMNPVRK